MANQKNGKPARAAKTKLIQTLVSPDEYERIRQIAEKEERSVSFIVARVLREYIAAEHE